MIINPRLGLAVVSLLALTGGYVCGESSVKDADNTARNEPDRKHEEVTPRDQGNGHADIDTTKRIRQGIIANKSLSTNAHNVKIITTDGHVTLRGPVNTDEEKRTIESIATSVTSAANVDCQLEVKNDAAQK